MAAYLTTKMPRPMVDASDLMLGFAFLRLDSTQGTLCDHSEYAQRLRPLVDTDALHGVDRQQVQ
ncbi:hypothetical protein RS3R1_49850 [Pseudomonas atacamensis]|uniref:Uncharacterized protein n=1 Tax=Pseudomonas atacamensis TaxID=2565368 RepID=A0ABQ5PRC2_9PSED|nr:hypothetical protein RS3R1_49850 [Pseudomonas atacamensis]